MEVLGEATVLRVPKITPRFVDLEGGLITKIYYSERKRHLGGNVWRRTGLFQESVLAVESQGTYSVPCVKCCL
jgi:hypothetical protein